MPAVDASSRDPGNGGMFSPVTHERRCVVRLNVTARPTAASVWRQLIAAMAG